MDEGGDEPIRPAFGIGLADYLAAGGKLKESDPAEEKVKNETNEKTISKQSDKHKHRKHSHHHHSHSHSKDKALKKKEKRERTKEYTLSEVIAALNSARESEQAQGSLEKRKGGIKIERFFADDFNTVGECYYDVKPDPDNLRYEEPDPEDVPRGWRLPRAGVQCLGLPDGVYARSKLYGGSPSSSSPGSIELFVPHADTTVSRAPERYWYRRKNAVFRDIKIYADKALSGEIERCDDFIQVDGGWRKRMLDRQRAESDSSSNNNNDIDPVQSLLRKTAELRQKLRVFPREIDLWIEYANLPDEYVKSSSDRRSLARKMDIYQEALTKNPQSEKLFLAYLEVCRSAWNPEQIGALWDRVIANQGTERAPQMTIPMWRRYLDFSINSRDKFTLDSVRSAYKRAIETLSGSKEKFPAISYADCERFLVQAFYELCCFEAKAGFRELALAMMQGICEYNFFAPKDCPPDVLKVEFAKFWDSETPRIGEEGSSGWCNWFCSNNSSGNVEEPPTKKRKRRKMARDETRATLSEESASFWGSEKAVEEAADEFLKELLGDQYSPKKYYENDDPDESDDLDESDNNSDESDFYDESDSKPDENDFSGNEFEEEEEDEDIDLGGIDYGEIPANRAVPLRDLTEDEEKEFRENVVKWARTEMEKDRSEWRPMRSYEMSTGEEEQYMQSVILSDDFEGMLFSVQLPENRLLLAYKFLELVGVSPPRWSTSNSPEHRFKCTMVETESAGKMCLPTKDSEEEDDLSKTWLCEGEWEGCFAESFGVLSMTQESGSSMGSFCERLLSQFSALFPDVPQVADTWLAYVARMNRNSKSVWHNLAKRLLEKYRTCLPLWHRYAQCEMVQGSVKSAVKVYKAALESCSSNVSNNVSDTPGKLEIAFAYSKMLLAQGKREREIFDVLTKIVGVSPAAGSGLNLAPTESVRVKKAYSNLMHDSVCYPHALGCLGILTFLTHGITSMRDVMGTAIIEAESEGSGITPLQRERGMEVYVSLCWWHATSPPLTRSLLPPPPRDLRAVLFSAVYRYPENPYFLGLLLSTKVTFRVKSFLGFVASVNGGRAALLSWLSAVRVRDDNAFVIRLCSGMVSQDAAGRSCGALWEELIRRNLRTGNLRAAKGALLKIIRVVPWDKHVIFRCLANEDMLGLLSVHDIRGILDLLLDKGLRIRQKMI